jgi:hypothetical protein
VSGTQLEAKYVIAEFSAPLIDKDQRSSLVVGCVNVQPSIIINISNAKIVEVHG